ncbi:MAG: ABC-F family ATP-binding cassette domain-containing protein [Candidatus Taylorbacteria bacterium]|nr:ABC-F family ATP-binding cassette domain-containing protein [Candidatus Taylorbacteria bacterium]
MSTSCILMHMSKKDNMLVHFKDASFRYGVFDVLSHIEFNIMSGDRIALVGANGAGKSSLLKYIAQKNDELELISGSVDMSDDLNIQYVPQIPGEEVGNLSGGEKTKRILSEIFAQKDSGVDVHRTLYVFDEPTNNLDADGLSWLQDEISSLPKKSALVVVSHDRTFLDAVSNKIYEIDEYTRTVKVYTCTYSEYREIKKKEIEDQWKDYELQQEEVKRLQKDVHRKEEWQRKIERTRANNRKLDPGEKEKPAAAYLRDKEGRMGTRAKVVRDRLGRQIEERSVEKPVVKLPIRLTFEVTQRSGEKVCMIEDAYFAYDSTQSIGPFNIDISYGQKVHIQGKNGSGKSTIVKAILGEIKPIKGKVVLGSNMHIGYLPQEKVLESFGNHKDIIDVICSVFDVVRDNESEGNFRMTLKRFGFDDADAKKHVTDLSSGERSRFQLALMYLMKPNCIVLDEPTNHLDIEAVEALEQAILEFSGTVILVSHDKKFVEKVGITKTVSI